MQISKIKMDIFEIYTERTVEKCPKLNFSTHRKLKNSKNKSVYSFGGGPYTVVM